MSGPVDVAGDAAARARHARRELVKLHHPDRGGDAERFVEVLAALDPLPARADHPRTPGVPPTPARPSGGRRRRALLLGVRAGLPRRIPGARRYATY
ncbi:hypothetical protein KRR39_19330 [Nocardioides panacis]|uniref:J domain-containing protein n=1 Tax=Nocardioides panacis TaxID=2849501 RepID=A0A975SX52_9ACTN|nr:hypothetical protein [Nocardioides panacis]QWZ07558.1 hypothetical protein KRR39_19330 [Nocardioides panacis]